MNWSGASQINTLLRWLGLGVFAVMAFHKVNTFEKQWKCGPKYHLPVSLVAPDGKHYADGELIDPISLSVIRTGHEEDWWFWTLVAVGAVLVRKKK